MTPERLKLVEEIFGQAIERSAAEREALLLSKCGDDEDLLREVRLLLECAAESNGALDGSAPALVGMPTGNDDPGILPAGTAVGPYTIRSGLGAGGMGIVYVGEQAKPRRTVALKVIRPGFATPNVLRRFEYEVEVLGRLQHPGIAQIIEAGTARTPFGIQPFFAMELVEGAELTKFAGDRSLNPRERAELFIKVCDAVEHAHQRGVIHRDLKPANILVDILGQPKILDFGVARATGGREAEQRLTMLRTGERQLVGTLAYMSPEQISGDSGDVDTRSDVYSLGAILFELLSGRLPHDLKNRSLPDAVRVIRDEEPRRLGDVVPECRGDLETICAKALEKGPADRYQSAALLASDLRRFLQDSPIEARPHSAVYQLRKFTRRNRGLVVGLAIAAGAIVLAAIFGTGQYFNALTARRLAEDRASEANKKNAEAQLAMKQAERESTNLRRTLKFLMDGVLANAYETRSDFGHAVSIVDSLRLAQKDLSTALGEDPLSEARLRYSSGLIFDSNAEYDASIQTQRRAAQLFATLPDTYASERMTAEQGLVRNLAHLGQLVEGERFAAEMVARDRTLGPRNVLPHSLGAQAAVLIEGGKFDLAGAPLREQFDLALASPGITPLNTYVQTRRVGLLALESRRFEEYERHWNERIDAVAKVFGGDSRPETRQFIDECAHGLEEAGEFARALKYRRRLFVAFQALAFTSKFRDIAFALARDLRRLDDPAQVSEAIEITARELAQARQSAGTGDVWLHEAAAEHVRSLVVGARLDEAARLAEESMSSLHHETGEWQYRVSEVRQAAAEAMIAAGKPDEARRLAEAEYQRRTRLRGRTHTLTIESLRTLAKAVALTDSPRQAGQACRAALDAQLETASMASLATLTLVRSCLEILLEVGDPADAEGLARRVLGERLCDPGTMRRVVVDLRCLLARSVAAQRGEREARSDLDPFAQELQGMFGSDHPWVVVVARTSLVTGK